MQDNFDLKGYLRHGNKLLNENLGGYIDLKPFNSMNEADEDSFIQAQRDAVGAKGSSLSGDDNGDGDNSWMADVDGMENYTVGDWKCYYDYPGYLVWSYGDTPFDQLAVYATPNFDTDNQTPIQVDVNNNSVENMSVPKGIFADFNEYAQAMSPYLDKIASQYAAASVSEGEPDGDQYDGKYDAKSGPAITNELEKPKSIYVTDDSEDEKGFIVPGDDDEFGSNQDRIMGLGGDKIENGIMSLLDDGFEAEDVMDFCKMLIDAHANGSNKFEAHLNEYESSYELINGKCYRVDDEGNRTAASMSKCR